MDIINPDNDQILHQIKGFTEQLDYVELNKKVEESPFVFYKSILDRT